MKEILGVNNQKSEKQLSYKLCEKCKERNADSMAGILCKVCYKKLLFEKLPEEAKKIELLTVVPERFIKAELSHLPKQLVDVLLAENDSGVLLWGPPGVGKSYAMCALAKHFVRDGFNCKRVMYEYLCLKMRDTFKPMSKYSEWDIIEPYINSDMLFIEDVGTTKSIDSKESDFSLKTILVLIDMRLERCKPTYITTNKSIENLSGSFDERIGDRLRLFKVLKIDGKSKR